MLRPCSISGRWLEVKPGGGEGGGAWNRAALVSAGRGRLPPAGGTRARASARARRAPMRSDAVRCQALCDLAVERALLRRPAGARDAGLGVDDDAVSGEEPLFEQRDEGKLRGRWVAPGVCDYPRLPHVVAKDLRQAVHRLLLELRRGVGHIVPLLVHVHISEAEVRGQVHHLYVRRDGGHEAVGHGLPHGRTWAGGAP